MKNNYMRRNFIWNLLGTSFNAFTSLFFLIIVTRINGVDKAGIFSFGFSTACLFFYIAIYSGRVFQVTEKKDISNKEFVVSRIINSFLMIIVTFVFLFIKHYSFYKVIVILLLCFYKLLEAFSDVFYGILQKEDYLYKAGISLVIKSVVATILLLGVDYFTGNIILSLLCMIIFNILVFIFYDLRNSVVYIKFRDKVNWDNIKYILRIGFFPFIISFLNLYLVNSSKYAIDNYLADNYQTIFNIIIMPATVLSLFSQFILYPYLNKISEYIKKNNYIKLNKLVSNICLAVVIFGIIAIILGYLLGIPVLSFIYNVDLGSYRLLLVIILVGAVFMALASIMTNLLVSIRVLKTQTILFTILALLSLIFSNMTVKNYGINGACYFYTLIMMMLFIVMFITYKICMRNKKMSIS